jgi:hypothetical protein
MKRRRPFNTDRVPVEPGAGSTVVRASGTIGLTQLDVERIAGAGVIVRLGFVRRTVADQRDNPTVAMTENEAMALVRLLADVGIGPAPPLD